jgi:hypothetical protein
MRTLPLVSIIFMSSFACAGLLFQCEPELTGQVQPGQYDVAVVDDSPVGGLWAMFTIALAPNGPFSWSGPIEVMIWPSYWNYWEEGGIHYWSVVYNEPFVVPNPSLEIIQLSFTFPQPGSSFELSLMDDMLTQTFDHRSFSIVPEPATLVLLGLGAVLLRARA